VQESNEDYAARILSQVFRVSVDPHHMTTALGHRLTFLPNLNQELNDAGEPLKLSISNLDQAIIEACTNWPHDKPLMAYLLPCWKRVVKASTAGSKLAAGPRAEIHEEAKRLCMSNCLFALTMPLLYG
jgi:ubiquitin conjugation factor E4 B